MRLTGRRKQKVQRGGQTRKGDGNKLRMYKTFKQALKSETYTQ